MAGTSKVACAFIDLYENETGTNVQHCHYDTETKRVVGTEFAPHEWPRKKVDGFYEEADGTKVVLEFLGDVWHGHPRFWDEDETAITFFNKSYKYLFEKTEENMRKLCSLGFTVLYVWQSEVTNAESAVGSFRKFVNNLEYKV